MKKIFSFFLAFLLLIAFITVSASAGTYIREADGWGMDRESALNYALKSAKSQISGVDACLFTYKIINEKPPQEQYYISLNVNISGRTISQVEGYGSDRKYALQDALTLAVAMAYGIEINSIRLTEKSDIQGFAFELYNEKSSSKVNGKIDSFQILSEKPQQKVYFMQVKAHFKTFDNWRAGIYSVLPGGGLIYKKRYIEGFAYLGAEAGMIAYAFYTGQKADDYRAKKNNPNYTFSQRDFYYDQETKYHNLNQLFLGLSAGVFALDIAHAILAKPKMKDDPTAFTENYPAGKLALEPYVSYNYKITNIGVAIKF